MYSKQPQKPIKPSRDFETFRISACSFLASVLFPICWLGCDVSSPLPPDAHEINQVSQEVTSTTLAANVSSETPAEKESAEVKTVESKVVTQEKQGAPFPLDADTKVEPAEATSSETIPLAQQEKEASESPAPAPEPSMLEKAGNLFNKAKSQGAAAASGTGKWVQDKLGAAAETGERTAEDTMKWANDTFNALKKQGLTTANDTSEWLSEDWKNMDSWEYHIETFSGEEPSKRVEKMNLLGKIGWECFHVDGQSYYFKKPTHSYLRSLPFKDVIKLVPLMGAAGNNDK